jgi:hypothetical protein
MSTADVDEVSGTIIVRLKVSRDEHRVPVTETFGRSIINILNTSVERYRQVQPCGLPLAGTVACPFKALNDPSGYGDLRYIFVHVENPPGLRVIARRDVISAQYKHVLDAQYKGPQQVGLQGQPVAITARHLQDRFKPILEEHTTDRQRTQPHDRPGHFGHIDTVYPAPHSFQSAQHTRKVRAFGRHRVCSYHEWL